MSTAITTALNLFQPELEARYASQVTEYYGKIRSKLGSAFANVYNDWTYARVFQLTVAPNCDRVKTVDNEFDGSSREVVLNQVKLARNAAIYASETIAAWEGKITAKLGELDNADVKRLTGCTFQITGTLSNHKVVIEQTIVTKVSSKGTVFNQFPARIYVDGKFTSEVQYKKLASQYK